MTQKNKDQIILKKTKKDKEKFITIISPEGHENNIFNILKKSLQQTHPNIKKNKIEKYIEDKYNTTSGNIINIPEKEWKKPSEKSKKSIGYNFIKNTFDSNYTILFKGKNIKGIIPLHSIDTLQPQELSGFDSNEPMFSKSGLPPAIPDSFKDISPSSPSSSSTEKPVEKPVEAPVEKPVEAPKENKNYLDDTKKMIILSERI